MPAHGRRAPAAPGPDTPDGRFQRIFGCKPDRNPTLLSDHYLQCLAERPALPAAGIPHGQNARTCNRTLLTARNRRRFNLDKDDKPIFDTLEPFESSGIGRSVSDPFGEALDDHRKNGGGRVVFRVIELLDTVAVGIEEEERCTVLSLAHGIPAFQQERGTALRVLPRGEIAPANSRLAKIVAYRVSAS